MRDYLFRLRENRGSDASHFPADYEKGRGKYVYLTPSQLSELLSNRTVDVVIPPVFKDTKTSSEFRGCANVRVYRIRFWLDGLRTTNYITEENNSILVQIKIKHTGLDTFVDVDNSPHVFHHDPIIKGWSYRLYDSGLTEPMDSGNLVNFTSIDSEDYTAYSAPGPFTTWTVSLEDMDERLDVSAVKSGRFEFFGTSRSFE